MDPWWVNIWKGYSLYSVTRVGCFCTQIYLILLPKFFPNAAGRILFGWNSFCGEISERFLPPPNTNTRVRKTQRVLPKQCVVHKPNNHKKYLRNSSMWHELMSFAEHCWSRFSSIFCHEICEILERDNLQFLFLIFLCLFEEQQRWVFLLIFHWARFDLQG